MSSEEQEPGMQGPDRRNGVDRTRRRLGQAAAGALPVYLALRHKSVRAGWACQSPSAAVSMNPSNTHNLFLCSGRSPGYWLNHDWLGTGIRREQSFQSIFGTPPMTIGMDRSGGLSLYEVLSLTGAQDNRRALDDAGKLSGYFVAALLNAASGKVPREVMDVPGIVEMWQSIYHYKTYEPYPGIEWGAADVKTYLAATWGEQWG